MKCSYDIRLDINKDIWNWYDASQPSSHGFDWRSNIDDEEDRKIYDQISKLDKRRAYKVLKVYLNQKYKNQTGSIKEYIHDISTDFKQKFDLACKTIEAITKRELSVKKFTFVLTTFPRCPYNPETGEIFFFVALNDPIKNFLHEILHFQFHHYWQDDLRSPVSELPKEKFEFLKESLTVVLDDSLKPLIKHADLGYPIHQEFRKKLYKNWQKHHDFQKLIDFGMVELKDIKTDNR